MGDCFRGFAALEQELAELILRLCHLGMGGGDGSEEMEGGFFVGCLQKREGHGVLDVGIVGTERHFLAEIGESFHAGAGAGSGFLATSSPVAVKASTFFRGKTLAFFDFTDFAAAGAAGSAAATGAATAASGAATATAAAAAAEGCSDAPFFQRPCLSLGLRRDEEFAVGLGVLGVCAFGALRAGAGASLDRIASAVSTWFAGVDMVDGVVWRR